MKLMYFFFIIAGILLLLTQLAETVETTVTVAQVVLRVKSHDQASHGLRRTRKRPQVLLLLLRLIAVKGSS
uniref:Uncharacterized protein n=1 Tax=Anopheles quadriannulatus TaxID=34691 RepID=A0A182XS05_ANOQN